MFFIVVDDRKNFVCRYAGIFILRNFCNFGCKFCRQSYNFGPHIALYFWLQEQVILIRCNLLIARTAHGMLISTQSINYCDRINDNGGQRF